jgi:hypothetical protein
MTAFKVSKSKDNVINNVLRQIVVQLMEELHYDFNTCEQCKCYIPDGKFQIHHTKYEGATFLDLQIVCQPCNLKPENRFLE